MQYIHRQKCFGYAVTTYTALKSGGVNKMLSVSGEAYSGNILAIYRFLYITFLH